MSAAVNAECMMISVLQIPKQMFSSCLASITVMPLQAVELLMTGLARAALPGLLYPGGCRRAPPPMRLLTGPAGTSAAAGMAAPEITSTPPPLSHHLLTLPQNLTKLPRARNNSLVALSVPSALSQNRYEADYSMEQKLFDFLCIHRQDPLSYWKPSSECVGMLWQVCM